MVSDELLVTEELALSHKKDPHQADSFWEHHRRSRQGDNFLSLIDTTTKDHQFGVRSVWEGQRAPEIITDPASKGLFKFDEIPDLMTSKFEST